MVLVAVTVIGRPRLTVAGVMFRVRRSATRTLRFPAHSARGWCGWPRLSTNGVAASPTLRRQGTSSLGFCLRPQAKGRLNAPMSTVAVVLASGPSAFREKPVPRWSVVMAAARAGVQVLVKTQLSPASSAGLPASSACVLVGPPLSASGPTRGAIGATEVPTILPLLPLLIPFIPVPSPIKLNELAGSAGLDISLLLAPELARLATMCCAK